MLNLSLASTSNCRGLYVAILFKSSICPSTSLNANLLFSSKKLISAAGANPLVMLFVFSKLNKNSRWKVPYLFTNFLFISESIIPENFVPNDLIFPPTISAFIFTSRLANAVRVSRLIPNSLFANSYISPGSNFNANGIIAVTSPIFNGMSNV